MNKNIQTLILKERLPSEKKYNDTMRSNISLYEKKAIDKNIINYISSRIGYHEVSGFKKKGRHGLCITWVSRIGQKSVSDFSYIPRLIIRAMIKERVLNSNFDCDMGCVSQRMSKKSEKHPNISAVISIVYDDTHQGEAFEIHDDVLLRGGEL